MDNQNIFDKISSTQDTLIHGTAADGTVRCIAAVTTNLVAEAAERHQTAPTATAAFGRTLTGALLLGATHKDFDRLTVKVEGNGIVEGIIAEANSKGGVRGYVKNPAADLPLNAAGKFDVRGIVGNGMFYVSRESGYDIGLYREPYRGSIEIQSGEIAEDFAYYLLKSEQIPSAVMLGVSLNPAHHKVLAAGGVMIQMMPGAEDKTIVEIENAILASPATTALIYEGATPADLLKHSLGAIDFEVLEEKIVGFACTCSYERAVSLIASIDRTELESMLREDKGAVMNCHFCNNEYRLSEAKLEEILKQK
jgi:molecular chaperone Hsp33